MKGKAIALILQRPAGVMANGEQSSPSMPVRKNIIAGRSEEMVNDIPTQEGSRDLEEGDS